MNLLLILRKSSPQVSGVGLTDGQHALHLVTRAPIPALVVEI